MKTRNLGTFAVAVSAVIALTSPGFTAIRHVKPGGPGTAGGTSWTTAFPNLDAALAAAGSGDDIWVQSAVYKPANQGSSFELVAGVEVYGGFDGTESLFSERADPDPATNGCVLSGDISGNDGANWANRSDNCYHVVKAEGSGITLASILDGFKILGGNDNDGEGAGIYIVSGASPTIRNCIFTDNRASIGAGAFVANGTLTFRDCDFIANKGFTYGGGMSVQGSSPTVVNCDFIDNVAESEEGTANGGGMQIIGGGWPKVFNCVFQNNSCTHVGGGISMRENQTSQQTLVVNCVFVGNHATDSGGGCRVGLSSAVRFVNCTFVENWSGPSEDQNLEGSGGGLSLGRFAEEAQAREAIIDNCIFWNNRVEDEDGDGSQIALIGDCGGTVSINYCNIMDQIAVAAIDDWRAVIEKAQ